MGRSKKPPKGGFLLAKISIHDVSIIIIDGLIMGLNIFMDYRMLVTTFSGDILQFQMFCYCMNKNWKGKRDLIVCLGTNDDMDRFKKIVDETFDNSWKIEINPTVHEYADGVAEQQINTIYYSVISGVEDIIVWDCKDFLLRPCDFSTFKKGDKYRLTYLLLGKKLVDMGYGDMQQATDCPVDHLTAISNIRPWIWNVEQLSRYWNHLNQKFGHFELWNTIPAGNEIYGYYAYMMVDPKRSIKFLTHPDMPLLFAGGYTHQTYDAVVKDAKDFDNNENLIVWKHSRKLQDPRCLDITKLMLVKYGIDPAYINKVYGSDLVPT